MRGLPGCGKSTLARQWVSMSPDTRAEVNRDAIRLMLGGYVVGSPEQEKMVTKVSHNSIRDLLKLNIDVVCSDTNLQMKYVRELMKIAVGVGAEVDFEDMTNVPLDTVRQRNARRSDKEPVPEHVIRKMYDQHVKGRGYPLPIPEGDSVAKAPDFYIPIIIDGIEYDISDLDGTLTSCEGVRSPYDYSRVSLDKPRRRVIDILRSRNESGKGLIIMTGRPDIVTKEGTNVREDTTEWLHKYVRLPFEGPFMRPADMLQINDASVKRHLFDEYIRKNYNLSGIVFDDRDRVVDMWRKQLGMDCMQVNYGDF